VEAYPPERSYLFGPEARDDAGPDSDYDLLIIAADDAPAGWRDCDLAFEAFRGTGTAADVIVWTCSQFEQRKQVVTFLPATVLRGCRMPYDPELVAETRAGW
jgi:predicted nucleotidyltransferase